MAPGEKRWWWRGESRAEEDFDAEKHGTRHAEEGPKDLVPYLRHRSLLLHRRPDALQGKETPHKI